MVSDETDSDQQQRKENKLDHKGNPDKGYSILRVYVSRVRAFKPNARFYLLSILLAGTTMGVFRLLFNFYVLSFGHDEALLGNFITTSNTTALLIALPMGYVVDLWGRKQALILRNALLASSVAVMALWPNVTIFYLMNAVFGIAQSIGSVAMGPFLMENSDEEERTYLFSFASGLRMASIFAGNWIGGYLPTWIGVWRFVDPESSTAYAGALLIVSLIGTLGLVPLFFIRTKPTGEVRKNVFAPIAFARENPSLLGKLFFPLLLISIGAGLFVPFMNVFFRVVHNQPDTVIGSLMAWGSLAMGIGLLIAPPIADRLGKLRLVVITQGLSIPFMILLGFVPVFAVSAMAYYARMALMNMSNPIYQNFVLEQVDPSSRATVASLHSMIWSFGRSFSPSISGYLQVAYGFGPPFAIAIGLYALAILFYWLFFIRKSEDQATVVAQVVRK
jgi:MFS family permease